MTEWENIVRKMIGLSAALVGVAMILPTALSAQQQSTRTGMIYHDLYIKLKDASPASVKKQLELGKRYLTGHPGEVSFTATVIAHDLVRHQQVSYLVNETNFDVSFHLIFKDAKAHNIYQTSEAHVKHFIPESSPNWTTIRVFDSEVQ